MSKNRDLKKHFTEDSLEWWNNLDKEYGKRMHQLIKEEDSLCSNEIIKICVRNNLTTPHILDAGAGFGRFSFKLIKELKARGITPQFVALDISKKAIQVLNEKSSENNIKMEVILGDVENLPQMPNLFDIVILWHILPHINNRQKVVDELVRVTKKKGHIIIEGTCWDSLPIWIIKYVGFNALIRKTINQVRRLKKKDLCRTVSMKRKEFLDLINRSDVDVKIVNEVGSPPPFIFAFLQKK